jgi:uncharacterized RDD family membrane protein YckC
MVESDPKRVGVTIELKPHAYDPATNPELFEGVLARRVLAFMVDLVIIGVPVALASLFVFVFGLITLGLGWWLFGPLLGPAAVIWAVVYYGTTLGSPASATIGMRIMELEMRTWYGAPCYFVLGAVHAVIFWITMSMLTPLILLVGLFNARHRLLHDILVGTVVINNEVRAAALKAAQIGRQPAGPLGKQGL